MYCKYCGNQLSENSKFCTQCGSLVEENTLNNQTNEQINEQQMSENQPNTLNTNQQTIYNAEQIQPIKKYSRKSIAGFVLSLVGLLLAGIPCGILGIVFSSIGLNEVGTKNMKGKGLAIAGLVISIIDIIGALIFTLMP